MNSKNNQIKSPIVIKGDIFSDYLNCNSFQNSLLNKDFAKPDNETFDKFFNNDENSIKSYNSLNDYSRQYVSKPSLSEGQMSNLFSLNNSDFIYSPKDKTNNEEKINNDDINRKCKFNAIANKEISIEEKKKKKLLMNRESAKKSRQKKKNYIENLEKQYMLLKEEFIKIREEQKLNNLNLNNQTKSNQNQSVIQNKKNKLISNNIELGRTNDLNNNANNQKRLMIYLLINQIDLITPIRIKSFQNKFLKMKSLEVDDSIEVIKNKIDMNLNIIIELYGIEVNNIPNLDFCNNKKSIAYQLYDYYKEVKSLVNKFETIYNNFKNI